MIDLKKKVKGMSSLSIHSSSNPLLTPKNSESLRAPGETSESFIYLGRTVSSPRPIDKPIELLDSFGIMTTASKVVPITQVSLGIIMTVGGLIAMTYYGEALLGSNELMIVSWVALSVGGVSLGSALPTHLGIRIAELRKSEKELQEGIHVDQELLEKIQSCFSKILRKEESGDFHVYKSQECHRIFSLQSYPNLIFKTHVLDTTRVGYEPSMRHRHLNMKNAKTICRVHQLGRLIIPNAQLLEFEYRGKTYELIVEKKYSLQSDKQSDLFFNAGSNLDGAIEDLTKFIWYAEYNDVEERNNPILVDEKDSLGNLKIGLVDLEHLGMRADIGLFGDRAFDRTGLVGIVNQRHGQLVKQVAKKLKVKTETSRVRQEYERRRNSLALREGLEEFYEQTNIQTGEEPINLPSNLDFPGYEGQKLQQLQKVSRKVIKSLNQQVRDSSFKIKPIQKKRRIEIPIQIPRFGSIFSGFFGMEHTGSTDEIEREQNLKIVCDRLKELNLIHGSYSRGDRVIIQA